MTDFAERLRHVDLKIRRAAEHAHALAVAMQAYLDAKPFQIGARRDPENRKLTYYVSAVQPVPDAIPLIAGDVIQNLMSALDHLAYQLVCKDTNDNPPNPNWIYFPIADDQTRYDAKKQGKMQGAAPATFNAIDALRPYQGGDDQIWRLYRLNNIEKHRVLLTVGAQAAGIHLGQMLMPHIAASMGPEAAALLEKMTHYLMPADTGFPLRPGFELYTTAPDEEPNPKLEFRFTVVLHEPGVSDGVPVMDAVKHLEDRVQHVVQTLAPLLKP